MIRPATVLGLAKTGFKVVPLDESSSIPTMKWSEVYDQTGWDLNELAKHYDDFHQIATCFGRTRVSHDGVVRHGWLNCLDLDSLKATEALVKDREWNDGKRRSFMAKCLDSTYVTRTKKGCHVYWLTADPLTPIHTEDCVAGWEFEIKSDKSGGLCHLPPSQHRNDPDFKYIQIGINKIAFAEGIYDFVLKEFVDYVKVKKKEPYIAKPKTERVAITLTDEQAHSIAVIIQRHAFSPGVRHKVALALAGFLCKWGVVYESAELVFRYLAEVSGDEEKRERHATLKETYKLDGKDKPIVGLKLLKEISPRAADRLIQIVDQLRTEKSVEIGMATKEVRDKK